MRRLVEYSVEREGLRVFRYAPREVGQLTRARRKLRRDQLAFGEAIERIGARATRSRSAGKGA